MTWNAVLSTGIRQISILERNKGRFPHGCTSLGQFSAESPFSSYPRRMDASERPSIPIKKEYSGFPYLRLKVSPMSAYNIPPQRPFCLTRLHRKCIRVLTFARNFPPPASDPERVVLKEDLRRQKPATLERDLRKALHAKSSLDHQRSCQGGKSFSFHRIQGAKQPSTNQPEKKTRYCQTSQENGVFAQLLGKGLGDQKDLFDRVAGL